MATFQIDLQYKYNSEYWTNTFYVSAADLAAAEEAAAGIASVLGPALNNAITIDKARVIPQPFQRNFYKDLPLNVQGSGGAGALAPLFVVVRWAWSKALGRPVSHYFRGSISPSNIGDDGLFTPAAQAYNQALLQQLFDLPFIFTDAQGQEYIEAAAVPSVGMRQLRRGSKRRTTPVI